jgi:phytoene synthase
MGHAESLTVSLEESYAFCRRIARTRARNFYYSFVLLSRERRNAMCAVYAFMRFCDDLSDEAGASLAAIEAWRRELDAALAGAYGEHPVWPAFHDTVRRFKIPHEYFHQMIDGVSSDLQPRTFESFEQLYEYCYHVAGVVGLTTIHIFGFESPSAIDLAEKCGVAFQITNILRDIREDREKGRTYLPAEDIRRFEADLDGYDQRFIALMRFEAERARAYYRESRPLIEMIDRRSRRSMWALIEIYRRLLDRIECADFNVLEGRISLPVREKLIVLARAALM